MVIRIVHRSREVVETTKTTYEEQVLHLRFTIGPVRERRGHQIVPTVAAERDREYHYEGAVDVSIQLQDHQEVVLSVTAEDAAGNAVADTGTLTWSVDDSSILTLTDNGDGTQTASATGTLGVATVTVSDAEPDSASFLGSVSFEIVTGAVTQVIVNAGAPSEIASAPAAPPADGGDTGAPTA